MSFASIMVTRFLYFAVISFFGIYPFVTQAWEKPIPQTLLLMGVSAAVPFIPQSREVTPWEIPFDQSIQRAVQAGNNITQQQARVLSDITLGISVGLPVTQGMLSALNRNPDDLSADHRDWMLYSTVNSFASNWILTETFKKLFGRKRPYAQPCEIESDFRCLEGPNTDQDFKSFPSGHTSFAFTGAALTCLHQARLKDQGLLFSSPWVCPLSIVTASATAFFRVRGNAHWFTDITAGAVVGLLSGFVLGPALTGVPPTNGEGASSFVTFGDLKATPPIVTTQFFF